MMSIMIESRRKLGAWCFLALVVVLGLAAAGADVTDTDLASWVEATATAAALLAAMVAATFAAGAFRLEARREERYEQSRQSAQAEGFACWANPVTEQPDPSRPTIRRLTNVGIVARNATDLPIYDVEAQVIAEAWPDGISPGSISPVHTVQVQQSTAIAIVEPGATVTTAASSMLGNEFPFASYWDDLGDLMPYAVHPNDHPQWTATVVAVTFRDNGGRRWRWAVDGTLALVA